MISAAEARKLSNHVWIAQLEQVEGAIKEAIIMGGHSIWYKRSALREETIEWLKLLDYKIFDEQYTGVVEISWEA